MGGILDQVIEPQDSRGSVSEQYIPSKLAADSFGSKNLYIPFIDLDSPTTQRSRSPQAMLSLSDFTKSTTVKCVAGASVVALLGLGCCGLYQYLSKTEDGFSKQPDNSRFWGNTLSGIGSKLPNFSTYSFGSRSTLESKSPSKGVNAMQHREDAMESESIKLTNTTLPLESRRTSTMPKISSSIPNEKQSFGDRWSTTPLDPHRSIVFMELKSGRQPSTLTSQANSDGKIMLNAYASRALERVDEYRKGTPAKSVYALHDHATELNSLAMNSSLDPDVREGNHTAISTLQNNADNEETRGKLSALINSLNGEVGDLSRFVTVEKDDHCRHPSQRRVERNPKEVNEPTLLFVPYSVDLNFESGLIDLGVWSKTYSEDSKPVLLESGGAKYRISNIRDEFTEASKDMEGEARLDPGKWLERKIEDSVVFPAGPGVSVKTWNYGTTEILNKFRKRHPGNTRS